MKKILLVFGTRPEAIKMAPLVLELKKYPAEFETIVCVTGQHREMLDQVLGFFDIQPEFDLDIMKANQDLYDITSRVLLGMRDIFSELNPDLVLVHGDTTTSTATALAAFYQQIPVAHVEAGLRTHTIYSPWPEEMNRQITGRIATYHFAPTIGSMQNLLSENIERNQILVTGNTVIDALKIASERMNCNVNVQDALQLDLFKSGYDLNRLTQTKKLILITGHRRENFGNGLLNICSAIKNLASKFADVDFVYPVHFNPNVRKPVEEVLGTGNVNNNVFLIEPLDYLPFVFIMNKSYLLLTDSGGIQEEAPGLGKPVLVMRDTTERPEAVEAGTVLLVGADKNRIEYSVSLLLENKERYQTMSNSKNPFGEGDASKKIVDFLRNQA